VTVAQHLDVVLKRLDIDLLVAVVLARIIQHRARRPEMGDLRRQVSGLNARPRSAPATASE
jgi:hypothetical protein